MNLLLEPYSLAFMRQAAAVAVILGVVAPMVGVWVSLRRLTYLGDAMSHGTLGGVGLAFLLGVNIVVGALAAGLLIAVGIGLLRRRSEVKSDAAIGIASITLFAFGVILITKHGTGVEISHFLFGQIATVGRSDLLLSLCLSVIAVVTVLASFRDLELTSLDPLHARQVGVRTGVVDTVVLGLVTLTVVVSLHSVGLLMSIAMLVVPANAARLVARTVVGMTVMAVLFGVASAVGGLTVSYYIGASPGATIALTAVVILVLTLVASWAHTAAGVRLLATAGRRYVHESPFENHIH